MTDIAIAAVLAMPVLFILFALLARPRGGLRYKLYGQDGRFIRMTCRDTPDMRLFVEWVRQHDRYTIAGEER